MDMVINMKPLNIELRNNEVFDFFDHVYLFLEVPGATYIFYYVCEIYLYCRKPTQRKQLCLLWFSLTF